MVPAVQLDTALWLPDIVAYIRSQGAWYEANDASGTAVELARVLKSQMYCAAYELMDSAPGTRPGARATLPQLMADDAPQQPCSHTRTRRTRPSRPPSEYELQSYRRRLDD